MSKAIFFLLPIVVAIGFFGVSYYLGSLPYILQEITNKAQPLINVGHLIYAKWVSIPPIIQRIILSAVTIIPSVLMTFFAWTKGRAMQKLEQTQQEATQLSGEAMVAQQQIVSLQNEKQKLENKVTELTQAPQLAVPQKQFNDVVSSYEQKIENMRNQFGMERNMLESEIKDLKEVKVKLKDGKIFVE